MDTSSPIILLDLGGVLVDLGRPAEAMGIGMSERQFWDLWLAEPLVHQFERGQLTAEEFFRAFGPRVGIPDSSDFERRFRQWSLRPFDGLESTLKELSCEYELGLLSNTNEVHWSDVCNRSLAFSYLSHIFLSFETGAYKPHASSFDQVLTRLGRPAGEVLFFDDTQTNVEAARQIGIQGVCVRGLTELRAAVCQLTNSTTG